MIKITPEGAMCQSIRCSCQFPNISLDQRLNGKTSDKEFHIKGSSFLLLWQNTNIFIIHDEYNTIQYNTVQYNT